MGVPGNRAFMVIGVVEMKPGYDGKVEIHARQVDSPYDSGKQEVVTINVRESNSRTLNLGPAQEAAYLYVYRLWYKAGHHRNGAIDPSNEPVDGGGWSDPFQETAMDAAKELVNLRKVIGKTDWRFIEITCLDGLNYGQVARVMYGREPTGTETKEASWHVKSAYNKLTVELGYSGTPTQHARMQSYMDGRRPGVDMGEWESTTSGDKK